MNYRSSLCITLLMLVSYLNADYTGIQYGKNGITIYAAIMKKWEPALNNLSPDSLNRVMKTTKKALKEKVESPFNNPDATAMKSYIRDIDLLPFTSACNELDRDIEIMFALINDARMLNTNCQADVASLQNLRAKMESLDCVITERKEYGSFVKYCAALMIGANVLCAGYLWSLPWQFKA